MYRSATYTSHSDGGGYLMLIILVFAAVAAGLVLSNHAAKHGSIADVVRNCPQDNIAMKLVNPLTGRMAILCEYEPDQFGRVIVENDQEVTSYASASRRVLNDLEHVIRNMHSAGYRDVVYVKPQFVDRIAKILIRIQVP